MDPGELIRAGRQRSGISQAELAALSGTSQATLSAYERGRKVPSAATLQRVLRAAGMRLSIRPSRRRVVTLPSDELERRGNALAAVIDLAERLPSSHSPTLDYPALAGRAG
jgi:transcriptional regulator with XRE-family HTH domain